MTVDLRRPLDEAARDGPDQPHHRVSGTSVGIRRVVAVVAVLGPVGWALARSTPPDQAIVNPGGLPLLGNLLGAALHPATSPDFLNVVLHASLVPVMYAALGTVGALAIAR